MARLLCVVTSLVNETPESAKFRTRGRVREKASRGDEVLLRGLDGTPVGYARSGHGVDAGRRPALPELPLPPRVCRANIR